MSTFIKGADGSEITHEQMEEYRKEILEFEEYMYSIKPEESHLNEETYDIEMREWAMKFSCDRPNFPGYIRANND